MRLLIVRHADPDYENDDLTLLGMHQAALLAQTLAQLPLRRVYASSMGRAQKTAHLCAGGHALPVQVLPWLREMTDVTVADARRSDLAVWNLDAPRLYGLQQQPALGACELLKATPLAARLQEMQQGTLKLMHTLGAAPVSPAVWQLHHSLADFGDIAVFCHQGSGTAWLAHLLGLSPAALWRSCWLAPSSVTALVLEEFEPGKAAFRMLCMGETAHLGGFAAHQAKNGLLYNPR